LFKKSCEAIHILIHNELLAFKSHDGNRYLMYLRYICYVKR